MSSLTFDQIEKADQKTFMKYMKDGSLKNYRPEPIPRTKNGLPGPIPLIRSPVEISPFESYLYVNRRWFKITDLEDLKKHFEKNFK